MSKLTDPHITVVVLVHRANERDAHAEHTVYIRPGDNIPALIEQTAVGAARMASDNLYRAD